MSKRQLTLSYYGKRRGIVKKLVLLSGSSLGVLVLALLLAPSIGNANAAEIKPFSADVNTKTAVYVRSSIAVSMTSSASMELVPISTGSFAESSDVSLSVATNNTTGYELYLTTGDNTSSLTQRNALDTPASINPVDGMMTEANYREHLDSWGYNLSASDSATTTPTGTGEYAAIPKSGESSVVKTDAISANDTYTLKFASAISTGLPAGVYSNTVVASVVANPIEVRSLSDITYMQEMTNDICTISLEHETKQLIDTRDNKSYWVAKLKDGRCWMVQNLALDIKVNDDGTSNIKASDSDVTADWTTSAEYGPVGTEGAGSATIDKEQYNATRSWDFGQYVVATPAKSDTSDVVNVSDTKKFQPGYQAEEHQSWNGTNAITDGLVAIQCTEWDDKTCTAGTYDEHYLAGSYYQWNTITAGSGGKITGWTKASESICPKGWTLPDADTGTWVAGSYDRIFEEYNIPQGASSGYNGASSAPLYFVRSEDIGASKPPQQPNTARSGWYWSARSTASKISFYVYLGFNDLNTHDNLYRYTGLSARCVNNPNL